MCKCSKNHGNSTVSVCRGDTGVHGQSSQWSDWNNLNSQTSDVGMDYNPKYKITVHGKIQWGREHSCRMQKNSEWCLQSLCPQGPLLTRRLTLVTSFRTVQYRERGRKENLTAKKIDSYHLRRGTKVSIHSDESCDGAKSNSPSSKPVKTTLVLGKISEKSHLKNILENTRPPLQTSKIIKKV